MTIISTFDTILPIAMDAEGSVSKALPIALRILLGNARPSLPPELIVGVSTFLLEPEAPDESMPVYDRSWSQNAALCHPNEELWTLEWLTSLAKVNRELGELLRPLLWTNVAIYVDANAANLALIIRLREHLEQNSDDRRAVRRLTLDLTVEDDYLARIGQPFDNINDWVEDTDMHDWPFKGIEGYEEECIRLAAVFPENLRTLQINCGQLRLHPKALGHIADRCTSLAVARIDANAERCPCECRAFCEATAGPEHSPSTISIPAVSTPFTKDLPPERGGWDPNDPLAYPQENDAIHQLRQVRGLALGCGPEPWPMYEDQRVMTT